MSRYIDRIAARARMKREAAKEEVEACGEGCYRELFDDDEIPEYAADEELLNWCE